MRRYQRRIGFGPLRFAWRNHQVPEDQKVGAVTGVSDQEMDLFTAAADFSSSAPVSIQESLAATSSVPFRPRQIDFKEPGMSAAIRAGGRHASFQPAADAATTLGTGPASIRSACPFSLGLARESTCVQTGLRRRRAETSRCAQRSLVAR